MVTFDLVVRTLGGSDPTCIVPFVDGHDLVDLVTKYERAEGHQPAGGYGGIVPAFFNRGPLPAYFLGAQEHPSWGPPDKIAVLGCSCGEVGCWPLYARVEVSATEVTWSAFEQPFRSDRTYDGFGPFTFDRRTYEAAVAGLAVVLDRPAE